MLTLNVKNMLWFSIALIALGGFDAMAQTNLINDGEFTTNILYWESSKSNLYLDSTAAESSAKGLVIDSNFDWCPYGATYNLDPTLLKNGTMYEFGARVRLGQWAAASANLTMGLIINSANPIWLDGDQSSYDAKAYTDRWTTMYGIYTPNLIATDTVVLCISGSKGNLVYVDNVYVRPLSTDEVGYQPPTILDTDALVQAYGNHLVKGPNNTPFTLKGVNVYQYDPGSNDGTAYDNFRYKNVNAASYAEIKALGFNTVRLMLSYSLFEDNQNPGVYKDAGWAVLDRHIQWAKQNNLGLILDMHVPPGGYQSASGFKNFGSRPDLQKRLEDLWVAIATRYRNEATIIAYDLINEPYINNWFNYAATLISKIRTVDSKHLIDVEVSFHPKDTGMYRLADNNILYDVHWYEPWSWAGSHTNNEPYTGNLETFKQQLRSGEGLTEFYNPATDQFTVPFNIGEYGVVFEKYEITNVNGKQWLIDANAAFDYFGINRELFAYNESNFGIYRSWNSYAGEHTITTEVLKATLPEINGAVATPPPVVPDPIPEPAPIINADISLGNLLVNNATPEVNTTFSVDFAVKNIGPDIAANTAFTLTTPSGVSWISGPTNCTLLQQNIICDCGNLTAGSYCTGSVSLQSAVEGNITLNGIAAADTVDDNMINNSSQIMLMITAKPVVPPAPPPSDIGNADLAITKFNAVSSTPKLGRAVGFNFIVKNNGTAQALNTTVTLPIPAGMSWVSGPGECIPTTTIVRCEFGTLNLGASRNRYVYLRANQTGSIDVNVKAAADNKDSNPANNYASVVIVVN
ncbi:conserved repeat domain protein [Achromatium sp. WMS2]|nr:conserved repeat domain protein [Achromatium sp. WMS2]